MTDIRWDQFSEVTTVDPTAIEALETSPSSTHYMKKITVLNKIKSYFKQNQFEKGASISNPDSGYMAIYCDSSGFFYSKDSSGNIRKINNVRVFQLTLFAPDETVTVGDDKARFDIPLDLSGMNIVYLMLTCDTVSSSGLPTVQLRNVTDSVDVLSTKLSINENEYTSVTATTPYVIDGTKDDVVEGDRLAADVDIAGTGTKGLRLSIGLQYP